MSFRTSFIAFFIEICLLLTICTAVPCLAQGAGSWQTSGNQIIDANGRTVRIAGINWYGFETTDEVVHGLWAQDYHAILAAIKNNGYNTIRLPYSNQMVESPVVPSNISYSNGSGSINADLKGLNSLEIMDKIITAAGADGLRVILVNHRSEAGNSAEANGLWYTSAYPESAWINDWLKLAARYASFKDAGGNPIVIGADLRNEPHLNANGSQTGSCWTGDSATNGCPVANTAQNWPAAAQRAGNAVLGVNPNLLIIVEGTDCYNGDCDWWGGNLEGVKTNPVVLNVANRLVYSPHDYGPALFQQSWFNSSASYSSLSAVWNKFWGYVSANNIAPIFLGEFGTDNNATDIQNSSPGSQGQWFQALVNFLQNNSTLSWTYWALNGEDSYALLDNQYDSTPAASLKQSLLASIQFPLGGSVTSSCAVAPSAPGGLAATAASSSQINLSWATVTPPTNCSVTYNVFRSTSNGFTPSSANQIAGGLTSTSFSNTGLAPSTTYYYTIEAVDGAGASAPSSQASAITASVSGGGGGGCHVVYSVVNQWNTGFQAAITIENTSSQDIASWTLSWSFPAGQQINGLWNGSEVQSGAVVTVHNLNYNGTIPARGSYNGVGFIANYNGSNPPPASFSLNGTVCN